MDLEHSFTVPVSPEQAWQVLLDVERVAPCMPGATVDSVDGDVIKGRIKVKVGPVTLTYSGTARFVERDEQARSVILEASGKETRGSGTAAAKVRSSLQGSDGQTQVFVHTTLSVTGRPAQFGRGVMAEVSGKIINQFAVNLAAQLAGEGTAGPGETPGGTERAGAGVAGPAGTSEAGPAETTSPAAAAGSGPASAAAAGAQSATTGGPAADDNAARLSIEEMRLSARAFNGLRQAGIDTVGDLSTRSESELLAIESLGPQSVKEIKQKLAERGVALSAPGAGAAAGGLAGATAETGPSADAAARASAWVETGGGTAGPSAATAPPRAARPADQDVIDLLDVAGVPVLKRALPVLGGLAALLLFVRLRSRRRAGGS